MHGDYPNPQWDPLILAAYHRLPREVTEELQRMYRERDAKQDTKLHHFYNSDEKQHIRRLESGINQCIVAIARAARKTAPAEPADAAIRAYNQGVPALTESFHQEQAKINCVNAALHNKFAAEVLFNGSRTDLAREQLAHATRTYYAARAALSDM